MAARTFDAFTTPKAGVIWGLSVPQLLFLTLATFPAWMAISSQRWLAGIMWVPVWLLLLFLTVVPLGGRPAVGWLAAAAAFAIAGLNGWLTFRSKAATGTLRDLDELDMPGALTGVEVLDGPPIGLAQRRIAVIKHAAARTWAITARIEHDGIAMATDALCNRYADGLTELLDTAARGELISEIHLMVRTTPDDCTERELWLRANITADAPVTSVATQIEHLRWSQAGVRTEAFITIVIPDNRLSKEARHMGGATDGRMNTLLSLAAEIGAVVTGPIGARNVEWLTSPELAQVVRLGFAPGDRAGLVAAAHDANADASVNASVPWALAGPSQAYTAVRHYAHDAWATVTSTVKLPERGATMGIWGHVLAPSEAVERRSVAIVFPIEKQSAADRKAAQQEFGQSLGQGLKDRLGVRTGAKDHRRQAKLDRVEVQLAMGATMSHPYALCSTTIPATAPVAEFGRRLEAAIRRGGMAPQRLDMSQDLAFVTATLPLGVSLTTRHQ